MLKDDLLENDFINVYDLYKLWKVYGHAWTHQIEIFPNEPIDQVKQQAASSEGGLGRSVWARYIAQEYFSGCTVNPGIWAHNRLIAGQIPNLSATKLPQTSHPRWDTGLHWKVTTKRNVIDDTLHETSNCGKPKHISYLSENQPFLFIQYYLTGYVLFCSAGSHPSASSVWWNSQPFCVFMVFSHLHCALGVLTGSITTDKKACKNRCDLQLLDSICICQLARNNETSGTQKFRPRRSIVWYPAVFWCFCFWSCVAP